MWLIWRDSGSEVPGRSVRLHAARAGKGVSGEHSPPCGVQLPRRPGPSWVLSEVWQVELPAAFFLPGH